MQTQQDDLGDGGILVVANATCPCPALLDHLAARAREMERPVLIVAPALNSRLAHWLSDDDAAVRGARVRLEQATNGLQERGIAAQGRIGDADPSVAIADWAAVFPPAEIVISTHPPGRSHWLENALVERTRARYGVPVAHVISEFGVVDEEAPAASGT
jgi:hypothetical protein